MEPSSTTTHLEGGLLIASPALTAPIGRDASGAGRSRRGRGSRGDGSGRGRAGVNFPAVDVAQLHVVHLNVERHFGHPHGDGSAGLDASEAGGEFGVGRAPNLRAVQVN